MVSKQQLGLVAAVSGAAMLLTSVVMAGTASATKPDENGEHKVTICHRTNSETNPYVMITVDWASVDGGEESDHQHHDGPVWYPGAKGDDVTWGDIIPPVEGVTTGLNWDTAGQALWNNGCAPASGDDECDGTDGSHDGEPEGDGQPRTESIAPSSSSEESSGDGESESDGSDDSCAAPTTTVPPTTEAPTTEAPTTEAPTTEAPTTEAPTTEAPTTAAPTTEAPTTEAPTTEAPTTEAPTTDGPTTTDVFSEVPTTPAPTTEVASEGPTTTATESASGSLPRTGSDTSPLMTLGLVLLGGGVLFMALGRRGRTA